MIILKIFQLIQRFMILLAKIQLVAMCLITFANVFTRYVLGWSIFWAEEISLVMMIWFCFIGLALGVKLKLHISIEMFAAMLPERFNRVILQKVIDSLILLFGIIMIFFGYILIGYGMGSTLAATHIPTAVYYVAPVISGLLIAYESFIHLFGLSKEEEGGANNA